MFACRRLVAAASVFRLVADSKEDARLAGRLPRHARREGESTMFSPRFVCRYLEIGFVLCAIAALSSGCVATRKFTRSEVQTSANTLNAKIEKTDNNVKETNDRVANLDTRTNEQGRRIEGLNGDLQKTNNDLQKTNGDLQKTTAATSQAQSAAQNAQSTADQTQGRVVTLEENFQNRNQYNVVLEKAVMFQFGSSKLEPTYSSMLDDVAEMVGQHPDALIMLEGRTDSTGDSAYNVQLGERRAEAVKRYLVVEKSVPMFRVHQTSFGAAKPIAENNSREGREKNRVVAVSVLVPRTATKAASNSAK
jgi:outer membrane protein OmpA-like peptidoglycan-associated protein